jgi:hypothetical protein
VAIRVSRPLSVQIEPDVGWTLEFSARTRSKYDDRDAAATFGFGSIILWIASTCAFSEGVVNNESKIIAVAIAKRREPLSSGSCSVTDRTLVGALPCACQAIMLNGESV